MKKTLLILSMALLWATQLRADDVAEYKKFAESIRNEVYSMDIPEFKVTDIPEKYKDESAVIIAMYSSLAAEKKTGLAFELWIPSTRARIWADELDRMLIHINDKNALDRFSEFDFAIMGKRDWRDGLSYKANEKVRKVLGAKIIKPDGRVIEVDTDDFLEVEEGKKGEEKRRKLAVPGLEVGDNLDVFFYTSTQLQNLHLDPIDYVFRKDYPVMYYKVHCKIDNDLTTQYRTLNGAPDFSITRDADENFILDTEQTDISAKTPRLWYNALRQSPIIQMRVYNRRSDQYTPKSARKDGVQSNPSVAIIKNDALTDIEYGSYNEKIVKDLLNLDFDGGKNVTGKLKNMRKKGLITDDEICDYLYNMLSYRVCAKRVNMNPYKFITMFNEAAAATGLDVKYGIVTPDFYEPLDTLSTMFHILWFGYVENTGKYYLPPAGYYNAPGETAGIFQGEKGQFKPTKRELKKNKNTQGAIVDFKMCSPEENREAVEVNASVDGTALVIDRRVRDYGGMKSSSSELLSEEALNKEYIDVLSRVDIKCIFRENKKAKAEREERYADGRRQQTDDFKAEIKNYHGRDAMEMRSGEIVSTGIDPKNPVLEYRLEYVMDEMVKNAGHNLIIQVGRLINDQLELLPSDRTRTDDVYMSMPREIATDIAIKIPEGYRVSDKTLKSLERNVDKSAGRFRVEVSQTGDKVSVKVLKRYNHKVEAATSWPALVEIVDAASKWQPSTLLLERI